VKWENQSQDSNIIYLPLFILACTATVRHCE
jgi:hypothetical protein